MKMESREALDAYYEDADSWARDREDNIRKSRRTAWIVAGLTSTIAVAEAIALVVLMPLKTVEPYTLLVDRQTGYVQALKPLDPELVSSDRALTQSFLVQYVIARESFDIATVQADYRKVALWSSGNARSAYVTAMQVTNPDSPLMRFPRSTKIETRVKSVTPMGSDSAMVRFDTIRRDAASAPPRASSWVAVVHYRYSGEPMSIEDRFINPLGFGVMRYSRSAEALNPAEQGQNGGEIASEFRSQSAPATILQSYQRPVSGAPAR
jgi:type IV secretion system protein VirB8